jgi:protein DGCR14
MFSPDVDESPYQPSLDVKGDKKTIEHLNTRLSQTDSSSTPQSHSSPPSPTRSRIEAAITGTACTCSYA